MKILIILFATLFFSFQSALAVFFPSRMNNSYYNPNYSSNYSQAPIYTPYYNQRNNTNYNNGYNNYRAPLFTGSSGSNWKTTMWNNFRNQLTGTPTGFTPALDPAYMDYFEAERANGGEDVDYADNYGYYNSHTTRGAQTGVQILED